MFLKYLFAHSSRRYMAKRVPTLGAQPRGRLRMEQMCAGSHQPRQTLHWVQWSFGMFSSTVAHNSPFFSFLWTGKRVCSRNWRSASFYFIMLGGLLWLNLFTQGEGLQLCMRELSEQGINQEVSKEGHKNRRLQERELGKVYRGTDMVYQGETYPEWLSLVYVSGS